MCFTSAILLAKPSTPGPVFWNLQQYMCIFALVRYVKYWGNYRWCLPACCVLHSVSPLHYDDKKTHLGCKKRC